MKTLKNKTAISISIFLILSMVATMALVPNTLAQVVPPGSHIPTYAHLNIFPNPAGVGQQVTFGIFLANPFSTNEVATNMTVKITNPAGTTSTLGPYTSDLTAGTVAYFTPDTAGNYSVQFFYGGQNLRNYTTNINLVADPSQSDLQTLVVQQEPISEHTYPFTALPTQWWQTPVSAENSQNWYALTGAWLGLASNSFATTGSYNSTSYYNPYTEDVTSGHVLWTKPWLAGGVAGGDFGGGEVSSHYWSTFQYTPRYAPVIINGIIYSTWYTFGMSSGSEQGIVAVNLYNGETLWKINTTNTLRCGMQMFQYTINDYGVRGPWIWTTGTLPASDTGGSTPSNNTGTQWNLYDGVTGKYVMSVVNGSGLTLGQDDNGNLIGYFTNTTAGTQIVHPTYNTNAIASNSGTHITAVNMTVCAGMTSSMSPTSINVNTFRAMNTGYIWDMPVPTNISGAAIVPALGFSGITGDSLVLTAGSQMWGTQGWEVIASMNRWTGAIQMAVNATYPADQSMLPYTRTMSRLGDGLIIFGNDQNYAVTAYHVSDGSKAWSYTLTGTNGAAPNVYDLFQMEPYVANGLSIWEGLGGDVWAINDTTGALKWYGNTTQWQGPSGIETPYNVWPIWVFTASCFSNNVAYFGGGHEYNPPLFHGAQEYAVNMTDGTLVWRELDFSVTSSAIAYSRLVTLNAYDNQLYCMGKGPTAITVNAPDVGVATNTPITITGTIMDVSPGTKQQQVASNYPNGLPCVSDKSESSFMETVYQQQTMPTDVTGVPVTISVIDSNGNFRQVGTTTSNALGTYGFTWTPDIPGDFTVYAQFLGSNSYYPSSASTQFYASLPATHEPTATAVPQSAADMYFVPAIAGLFVLIIIVAVVLALLMLRKRP